jgi:hypothetical protein
VTCACGKHCVSCMPHRRRVRATAMAWGASAQPPSLLLQSRTTTRAVQDLPKRLGITKCPTLAVIHPDWTGRENNTMNHVVWDGEGDWRL